jgi:probable HAF family extracellular repeat protein
MALRGFRLALIAGVALLAFDGAARAASLTGLGAQTQGAGVSADGSTVAGVTFPSGSPSTAMRWTLETGAVSIGTLGGSSSNALDISSDGTVIVGYAADATNNDRAFRWTQAGMVALGSINGSGLQSYAQDVSSDGAVIVGSGFEMSGLSAVTRAFRWTEAGGMASLGTLGGTESQGFGVSGDGAVVVGSSQVEVGGLPYAYRWTSAGGMENLGTLDGDEDKGSVAIAISADGGTIVGLSGGDMVTPTAKPFRWTEAGGMIELAKPAGATFTRPWGISDDGKIVVGEALVGSFYHAYLWDETGAAIELQSLLEADGVDLTGWTLESVASITGTGGTYYLTGFGTHNLSSEGFLVVVPEPGIAGLLALGGLLVVVRRRRGVKAG